MPKLSVLIETLIKKMSKTLINISNKYDRTIVLVDMDCFYCQVEEKLDSSLKGKPIAVVQYNAWKGGGIIAVNYAAREQGVTMHMRGDEAKEHCPDIQLVKVPNIREKADLSKYREAGKEVASVLQTYTEFLERASVDEAYLDISSLVSQRFKEMNDGSFSLTPDTLVNCYAVGFEHIGEFIQNISKDVKPGASNSIPVHFADDDDEDDMKNSSKYDIKLLIGASIVSEIRQAVKEKTGYECSAGIAHNKILAKLVCGMNKPNKQTVLPLKNVSQLYSRLPIKKIKGLGGKFGDDLCNGLKIKFMSELKKFTQAELQKRFDDKTGLWLFQIARGVDLEAVTPRFASKSIACCKKFPGRNSIKGIATLTHWLTELSKEIIERLEKDEIENNRIAKQMVVSFTQQIDSEEVASTRSVPLNLVDVENMTLDALDVIKKNTKVFFKSDQNTVISNPITFLGISAGKFEDTYRQKRNTIKDMFNKAIKDESKKANETVNEFTKNDNESQVDDSNKASSSSISSFFCKKKPSDFLDDVAADDINNTTENNTASLSTSTDSNTKIDLHDATMNLTTVDADNSVQNSVHIEENEPMAGPSSNYKSTYAEFLRPIIPDELFQICTQCNKKLLISEMQSHLDMHIAFQLSQEQRIEYRSQLKNKKSPPLVTASKKPKLDRSVVANISSTSITSKGTLSKFLVKHNKEVSESSVSCDQCGKFIAIDEVLEHSDYHAAKRLQMEINSNAANDELPTVKSNRNGKTKSGSNSATNTRSIASFFKSQ